MKNLIILYCLVVLISSCNKVFKSDTYKPTINDLPSKELIDSVIKAAIIEDSINLYKLPKNLEEDKKGSDIKNIPCNLNSDLKEITSIEKVVVGEMEMENIEKDELHSLGLYYINMSLKNRAQIDFSFNTEDSCFIDFQIRNSKPLKMDITLDKEISFIDDTELECIEHLLSNNIDLTLFCCEIYRPLFNKNKDAAIVGISYRNFHSRMGQRENADYIVMHRINNKWKIMTRINWINNN